MCVFQVDGYFYVNDRLEKLMFDELKQSCNSRGFGGFLPGMKQIANVAALPGIVSVSVCVYVPLCVCVCESENNVLCTVGVATED